MAYCRMHLKLKQIYVGRGVSAPEKQYYKVSMCFGSCFSFRCMRQQTFESAFSHPYNFMVNVSFKILSSIFISLELNFHTIHRIFKLDFAKAFRETD